MASETQGDIPAGSPATTAADDAGATAAAAVPSAAEPAPPTRTEQPLPAGSLRARLGTLLTKVTLADDPVLAAEPASPHVAPEVEPAPAQPAKARAFVLVAVAVAAGLVGAVLIAATSPEMTTAAGLTDRGRFAIPGLPAGKAGSSLLFGGYFLVGIVLLALGWLGLLTHTSRRVQAPASRVRLVVGALVLWSLPFLAAPVQLSTDAYSYAAQGYMATQGLDPSAVGPTALPHVGCYEDSTNCYWAASDQIWRDSPAPYGPVAVGLAKFAVIATGENTYWTVFAFRLFAVAGVGLAGLAVYGIARRRQVEPAMALAIAVANPVVIVHLVGGAHNDALMMGLLLMGLALWERSRRVLAVLLVTLAVCVKLPAVLALGYMAWNWRGEGRDDAVLDRLKAVPVVGALVAGLIGVLCLLVGIGLGWVTALSSTGKITSTFSPFTKFGFIAAQLTGADVLYGPTPVIVSAVRLLGLAVAGAVIVVLLARSPKIGVTKSTGIALLALMVCSPVIWPWYLPVGFAVLAAVGIRRYRPTLIVLVIASSLLVWPITVNAVANLSEYQHYLGMLVVGIITACCVGAQYLARWLERRREEGLQVPTIEAVLITPAAATPDPAR